MSSNSLVLRVDHNATYIQGRMSSEVYAEFKKALGYLPENAFWMVKTNAAKAKEHEKWKKEWDGQISAVCWNKQHCHCHIKKRGLHFHTGLLSNAVDFFRKNNISFRRIDIRSKVEKTNQYSMSDEFEFRDYQQDVINKVIGTQQTRGIDRGIIKAATGSGKTSIASGIIAGIGVSPTIFYVPSIDLLKQAKDEIEKFVKSNRAGVEVGMVGGGKKDIKDITVMTIQTAVRALGGVWIKFDEEDNTKDDTNIDDIKKDIQELISTSKLMIADECLEGDTLIETEKGKVKISDVLRLGCEYVLSHNGSEEVWKRITAFMPKGEKKVLKITLNSGKQIRCTSNHPFMTRYGWIKAGDLTTESEVFVCDQKKSGNRYIKSLLKTPLFANADVGKKSSQNVLPWNFLLNIGEIAGIGNTSMVMINAPLIGIKNYQSMRSKQCLEHYWEIPVCPCLLPEVSIQDCLAIIVQNKGYGQNIKPAKCLFYLRSYLQLLIEGMEKCLYHYALPVTLRLKKYIQFLILMGKKKLVKSGLTGLEMLGWHGGYVTMAVEEEIICDCIQKDFQKEKMKLFFHGCKTSLKQLVCLKVRENIILFPFVKKLCEKYYPELKNISQNVCSTNLETVMSVEDDGYVNVFDIEVEDTHCFFANGILVHNCQHWAAETCQIISDASISCQYKYAFSATPYRDKGDDILIQGCFGRTIADINASFLIRKKYLIKPTIYFKKINNMRGMGRTSYANIYKQAIVENVVRNNAIVEMADRFKNSGRKILILVRQISHGKMLEKLIPESIFMHGSTGKKKREKHLDQMRRGEPQITIASVIFDEGIDVRPLDTLILAGGGKCICENTLLNTSKGVLTIKELAKKINIVRNEEDCVYDISNFKICTNSHFNSKNKINKLYKGGQKKCYRIVLQNGMRLEATGEHRLRIIRNGKVIYKKITAIDNNDFVLVKKGDMLFSNEVNKVDFYQNNKNGRKIFNVKDFETDPLFAKLIGYIICEGSFNSDRSIRICNVFSGDEGIFNTISNKYNLFIKKYKKNHRGPDSESNDGWYYDINSVNFVNLFNKIIGYNNKKDEYVPLFIREGNANIQSSFIRSVFDSEGSVTDKKCIEITMKNRSFLEMIQLMLLNFGIFSRLNKKKVKSYSENDYWKIVISNKDNIKKFVNSIGFDSTLKMNKALELSDKKYNPNIDIIPSIKDFCRKIRKHSRTKHSLKEHKSVCGIVAKLAPSSTQNFTKESLKRFLIFYKDMSNSVIYKYLELLLDEKIQYVKVKSVTNIGVREVYDLSVDYGKSYDITFVANGMITHNSPTRALQRIGRILRPYEGKKDAIAVDFMDNCKYMLSHSKKRLNIYKTEDEFEIIGD